jgi:hypothetical protein
VNRDQWARSILNTVWREFGAPAPGVLQAVQAIARHESGPGYGDGMGGANNWGSIHCTSGPPCGEGCVEHQDTDATGQPYVTCFRRYATPEEGARDLIRELLRRGPVRQVLGSGNATAIASAMRATKYFEAPTDVYSHAIARNARAVASAVGEPLIVTLGGTADASFELFVFAAGVYALSRYFGRRRRRRKG